MSSSCFKWKTKKDFFIKNIYSTLLSLLYFIKTDLVYSLSFHIGVNVNFCKINLYQGLNLKIKPGYEAGW